MKNQTVTVTRTKAVEFLKGIQFTDADTYSDKDIIGWLRIARERIEDQDIPPRCQGIVQTIRRSRNIELI